MQIVQLDQNTKEWLDQRKRFIGGSDVPSIMMVSPWRTVFQLWEEKLLICTPDHAQKAYIFERGHRFESYARQAMELRIGFDIPAMVVQHKSIPWARVSLDCLNVKKGFVGEVKYMGQADWLLLKHEGKVPDHYWPQVQYQLMVTGLPELHFIGINEQKQVAFCKVTPDLEYMRKMTAWCEHFWMLVKERRPPKMVQDDYKFLTRKDAVAACNKIHRIDQQIGKLFEERDRLQDVVLGLAKSTRMVFGKKVMIRLGDFDHGNLGAILELRDLSTASLGRSLKDNLKLIIVNNQQKHIKGASNVRRSKASSRKRSKKIKAIESSGERDCGGGHQDCKE
jgi:putative phage-type endonuclease